MTGKRMMRRPQTKIRPPSKRLCLDLARPTSNKETDLLGARTQKENSFVTTRLTKTLNLFQSVAPLRQETTVLLEKELAQLFSRATRVFNIVNSPDLDCSGYRAKLEEFLEHVLAVYLEKEFLGIDGAASKFHGNDDPFSFEPGDELAEDELTDFSSVFDEFDVNTALFEVDETHTDY